MVIFVDRVAELPRLLDALQYHPDGMRIDDLAAEVRRTPEQVREVLLTYYSTDFAPYAVDLMWRSPAIEFVSAGEDDDPAQAAVVRLAEAEPGRELGWPTRPSATWPASTRSLETGWLSNRTTRSCSRRPTSSGAVCCPAS